MSVTKTTPRGPHRVGERIVHKVAPRARWTLLCGKKSDNGFRWCWCQWLLPGTPLEGGGDPAECPVCTHFDTKAGVR